MTRHERHDIDTTRVGCAHCMCVPVVSVSACAAAAAVLWRLYWAWLGWVGQPDTNFEGPPPQTPLPFPKIPTGGTCLGLCCRSPKVSVPRSFCDPLSCSRLPQILLSHLHQHPSPSTSTHNPSNIRHNGSAAPLRPIFDSFLAPLGSRTSLLRLRRAGSPASLPSNRMRHLPCRLQN